MYKLTIILFCFGVCASDFVEELEQNKCDQENPECLCNVFNVMMRDIAKGDAPEYGIELAIDPYDLTDNDFTVRIPLIPRGVMIHLTSGELTGLGQCRFSNCNNNFFSGQGSMDIICDHLKVVGTYDVKSSLVHAENGNADMELKNLTIHLKVGMSTYCGDNGKMYAECKKSISGYSVGDLKANIDKLFIGRRNYAKQATSFMKNSWKFVVDSPLAKELMNRAFEIYSNQTNIVLSNLPANKYLKNTEELEDCKKD